MSSRAPSDLPPAVRRLLTASGFEVETPPTRRIFTNRDLDLDKIQVVGFDMDYTLARYRQVELERVSIDATLEKLVVGGYPEALRERVEGDPNFEVRGLIVDKELGNLLKMDRHGYVGRAYHGRAMLPRSERKAIYRAQRISSAPERFVYTDTLFSLPELTIFAALVELIDAEPGIWANGGPPSYAVAWADVRNAIDEAHQDDSIKRVIKADPGRFIEHDPELAPTLHKLRSAGKKLFLLTNSYFEYSDAVMRHLLHGALPAYEDWRVYFDWMVVGSQKPAFFTEQSAFLEMDPAGQQVGKGHAQPQKGKVYQGGNRRGLQESFGVQPDEVLYVGDHIYGDVVKSKKVSGWRTVLVVEELERELAVRSDYAAAIAEIEALSNLRNRLTEEISAQRHLQRTLARLSPAASAEEGLEQSLDDAREEARARFDRLRAQKDEVQESLARRSAAVSEAFNPYWGSVFAERQDASLFGAQIESYACLYTSRVSNFLFVSPARYFHAPHGSMPHWRSRR